MTVGSAGVRGTGDVVQLRSSREQAVLKGPIKGLP
jgi:hypothetical protein